jgi:uracil-DNA glycosylase
MSYYYRMYVRESYYSFGSVLSALNIIKHLPAFSGPREHLYLMVRPPKIVFVGSNPSKKSPDLSAFHPDTASGKMLRQWISDIPGEKVLINVADEVTQFNSSLSSKQIEQNIPSLRMKLAMITPDRIVAVGETAAKALRKMSSYSYTTIPHPSGLNRKLNDPRYVEEMLTNLKSFCRL